ncbi:hypothetical protein A8F94_03685 [Bacillus sp. FJAT-27225]|uniref:DUF309 domain-containing protein n=1 Tax=Bacillus sp. FJAT-27225 TaxID=1743144 RepID=UPI00080C2B78|nr:DUF309 domain-containing protein [Bacillus sp. FJAT-27225]OCA90983.1 hypothetical protein A8F94_03685 [Bacillus sp. FJAT-27225]
MYPEPYIEYLAHFHGDHDFFECHELLEEYWKEVDPGNKKSIWVAFIQLAVGCYHFRRRNTQGAAKNLRKSLLLFKTNENLISSFGINREDLFTQIEALIEEAITGKTYKGFSIPIEDEILRDLWVSVCKKKGLQILESGYMPNESIIHRHKTRDRTIIINERQQALLRRNFKTADRDQKSAE